MADEQRAMHQLQTTDETECLLQMMELGMLLLLVTHNYMMCVVAAEWSKE